MPFTELEAALDARKRKINRNRIELLPKVKNFLDSIARNSIKTKRSYSSGLSLLQNFLNSEAYHIITNFVLMFSCIRDKRDQKRVSSLLIS